MSSPSSASASASASATSTSISDLDQTLLCEIFSFFTLDDLQNSHRIVSKSFHAASQELKEIHYRHLSSASSSSSKKRKCQTLVQIQNLQSEKGRKLNGKIGIISGKYQKTSSRFPIEIRNDITNETTKMGIKASNLNIYPSQRTLESYNHQTKLLDYSNDSKVRVPHGMLLEECIITARWLCNEINGRAYYNGSRENFFKLPSQHPSYAKASASMFTFWNVNIQKAGLSNLGNDMTLFDMIVADLIHMNSHSEQSIVDFFGKKAKWELGDGKNGELILRQYVRFMKSWATERISGKFWVTDVYETGTIMVKVEDEDLNTCTLGKVYLVRGQNSVIGELLSTNGLPCSCYTTVLPLYHFLVYDGMLMRVPQVPYGGSNAQFRKILKEHVQNAIENGTVVTMGESAKQGLWDDIPPTLPYVSDDGREIDWGRGCVVDPQNQDGKESESTKEASNTQTEVKPSSPSKREFTQYEKESALQLAQYTAKMGILPSKTASETNTLLFKRYGYTKAENPNRICLLFFNSKEVEYFDFQQYELTYDLPEVLDQLLNFMEDMGGFPKVIQCDEFSVVEPLTLILKESFDKVGVKHEVNVQWHPPPGEEDGRKTTPTEVKQPTHDFTERESRTAYKLTQRVRKMGVLPSSYRDRFCGQSNSLLFRRYGYTKEENPNKICLLMFNFEKIDYFEFKHDELTYNLQEVMDQLLLLMEKIGGIPSVIQCDELSVVEPLDFLLKRFLGLAGVRDGVTVQWYPPPSEEETRFASW